MIVYVTNKLTLTLISKDFKTWNGAFLTTFHTAITPVFNVVHLWSNWQKSILMSGVNRAKKVGYGQWLNYVKQWLNIMLTVKQ